MTKCSNLSSGFRYDAESVFATFPGPQFSSLGRSRADETLTSSARKKSEPPHVVSYSEIKKIDAEAAAARGRTLELPGANPWQDAQTAPATAGLTAYGFSAKKDLLAQRRARNQPVATKIQMSELVMPPGVPKNYPDAKKLVTADCIRP